MLKKIITYILSLTLITSQNMNVMVHAEYSKIRGTFSSGIIINQLDESFDETGGGEESLVASLSENKLNEEESSSAVRDWIAGSSVGAVLSLITAMTVKKNTVQKLIAKLEKQNIKISNNDIICALTCSAIQGISFVEGKYRACRVNKNLIYDLVKTLAILRAYHCVDILFKLGIYSSESLHPELLKVCLTSGDDMIGVLGHDKPRYIENQIKKANVYINKIKTKFENLPKRVIFAKFDSYEEYNVDNLNAKQGLLQSLLVINMGSEKLDNLVKTVVDDNY